MELNKVLALSGLVLLALGFCPGVGEALRTSLVIQAQVMLVIHSSYSILKYYGGNNIPALKTWLQLPRDLTSTSAKARAAGVKKVSVIAGSVAQGALGLALIGLLSVMGTLCWLGVGLGTVHFYLMEIDFKWRLGVRPFAYIVFPLVLLALFTATWGEG